MLLLYVLCANINSVFIHTYTAMLSNLATAEFVGFCVRKHTSQALNCGWLIIMSIEYELMTKLFVLRVYVRGVGTEGHPVWQGRTQTLAPHTFTTVIWHLQYHSSCECTCVARVLKVIPCDKVGRRLLHHTRSLQSTHSSDVRPLLPSNRQREHWAFRISPTTSPVL